MDYGDNVNGGVKLNLSFESSQMTSRLPPSGLEELVVKNFFHGKVCTLVKTKFAYKLPPKL